ncbi:hypothetical protein BJ875DRAFT_536230 [Amylocarpus encephaloides]|uniref:Nephrocystin 3-like N-terminal domain-containing protein n=1 Tax=Amylocarpus encephaloides TaxID=45428 RepID=A0A9P7YE59_9HELO|nr:hypothetical protein BJ875DRAFT_536230 [Amylocarpus encephaloides]
MRINKMKSLCYSYYKWPPKDTEFENARICSFGYNSDWGERKDSVLNIHGFRKSLLSEMLNSSDVNQSDDSSVILVGHSMGGLVIKQLIQILLACILATHDPSAKTMGNRIHGMIFLAVPHRGADIATLLSNMLKASILPGKKPFVSALERNSGSFPSINEDFRLYAHNLELLSFYEALPMKLGLSSSLIVARTRLFLASPTREVLYPMPHIALICKFELPLDPNYVSVRNSLSTLIRSSSQRILTRKLDQTRRERAALEDYLDIPGIPDEELEAITATKFDDFQAWRDSPDGHLPLYWLNAQQTSGKSVMAAHLIRHLQEIDAVCSYFFFKHNDESKIPLSSCFRSLTYHMALSDDRILQKILLLKEVFVRLDHNSGLVLWRRLLLGAILIVLLRNDHHGFPLRVFMTSRPTSGILTGISHLERLSYIHEMTILDTSNDISQYVEANMKDIALSDQLFRQKLADTILAKACVQTTFSNNDIQHILDDVPQGINAFY